MTSLGWKTGTAEILRIRLTNSQVVDDVFTGHSAGGMVGAPDGTVPSRSMRGMS